jgi:hypothetical protein
MKQCWRCGGSKTITLTTTGTHVLPCPTCGGSGELAEDREEALRQPESKKVTIDQRPAEEASQMTAG